MAIRFDAGVTPGDYQYVVEGAVFVVAFTENANIVTLKSDCRVNFKR